MNVTAAPRSVTVRAPGKINVYFRVGALQDDGFHEVASLYQAVSLFEDVTATESETYSVAFSGSVDATELATDDSNLAIRAAKLLATKTKHTAGVALSIVKNVPIAGGMGGGSADAAATLVACDALWQTGLSKDQLLELAAELGSDVPFAMKGGTAVGTGRGDELSPALATGTFHWVLLPAQHGLSTPDVYRALDEHRNQHQYDISPSPKQPAVDTGVLQAIRLGDAETLAETMHNDLQAAALKLAPNLTELLELGEASGALAGIVSGSGPTLAFLTDSAGAASNLQHAFARNDIVALTVTGPVPGARIIADSAESGD